MGKEKKNIYVGVELGVEFLSELMCSTTVRRRAYWSGEKGGTIVKKPIKYWYWEQTTAKNQHLGGGDSLHVYASRIYNGSEIACYNSAVRNY